MNSPMSHVVETTDARFQKDVIEKSGQVPVVVDFWAPWCGPCRMIGPLLEKLAAEGGGAWILAKVNSDENPMLGRTFQISGIPTVLAFRNGKVVSRFVGAQPEKQIRDFLTQILPSECDTLAAEGEKKRKAGRFEDAEEVFSKALKADRVCAPALLGLARLRADQGRTREAAELLEEVPLGTPERAEADKISARLRVQTAGSLDTEALRLRVQQNPGDVDSRYELGLALAAGGLYEDALREFLEVVTRDRTRKGEAARKSILDIFQILGPEHPLTQQYRPKLASTLFA
jgi:putative thioredoxin